MLDLPFATHRSLIEPLTGETHVKLVLIRRYLVFIEKIKSSNKAPLKMLMKEAMLDMRSDTGGNMRNIMLLVGKTRVEDVGMEDLSKLEEQAMWKVPMIKEIINIKSEEIKAPGFHYSELDVILEHLCVD